MIDGANGCVWHKIMHCAPLDMGRTTTEQLLPFSSFRSANFAVVVVIAVEEIPANIRMQVSATQC